MKIRSWLWAAFASLAVVTCVVAYQFAVRSPSSEPSPVAADRSGPQAGAENTEPPQQKDAAVLQQERPAAAIAKSAEPPEEKTEAVLQEEPPAEADAELNEPPVVQQQAAVEAASDTDFRELAGAGKTKPDLSWLGLYAYSELPPETKPADTILGVLKDAPAGTPIEEIRRVSDILKLDFTFMKSVAKIESGFNPKARTGSYIGLFQISNYEFGKFGSGDILDPRANTVAAALKIMTEATLFEMFTHRKTTLNDLYLIHQQGVDGAAEHIRHPGRLAWKSMCATEEGKRKGEKWCKRAIWGNTLPAVKRAFKSVNKVTSAAFVDMWRQRLSQFYTQYSEASASAN